MPVTPLAQGRLLTKKKEERKGEEGRFNSFATAGLRTQSARDDIFKLHTSFFEFI